MRIQQGLFLVLRKMRRFFPHISLKHSLGVVFVLGTLSLSGFLIYIFYLLSSLPTLEQISNRQIPESTKIYDREGKVLLYEISAGEKRTVLSLEEIPRFLKDAVVAIEDQNFYSDPGFSIRGILRSLFVNIQEGEIAQGGSTITQQLARNAFLTTEQTIPRKLKELLLAVRLTNLYSKDEVLALYLNEIPYGPVIYGIEAASRVYFGKQPKELTIAEAAVLAAIPQAPTYYFPWGTHQKQLFERQRLVLKKMRELGKISEDEYQIALNQKIEFQPQDNKGIKAPHFVITVQEYLAKKYGEDFLRTGGLRVITTLDWKLQELAESTVKAGAERNDELYKGKNAALVAQDPKTGQILALVGSRDYFDTEREGNFNVATQGLRQPGSALKPFVYMSAFSKGLLPETVVFDVPTEFVPNEPECPLVPVFSQKDNPKCFHPQNFDNQFRGPVSLRNALAESLNIPAVKILYIAGMKETLKTLQDFGITTLTNPQRYGLSLVLGGGEVRLSELVGAYSTLAQEGIKRPSAYLLEVKNNKGDVLEKFTDQEERVIDPLYPQQVNNILSDIEARRPLYGGSLNLTVFPERDVAIKTGTTNDYRDAWAVGYTPSLVVGVWAGNNDNSPMQRRGSSLLAAIPIWSAFFSKAIESYPKELFTRPEQIVRNKPMLNGDYLWNKHVHSLLFYIDKKNPLGDIPSNPAVDPQFQNWEQPVLNWASINIPGFAQEFNNPGTIFDLTSTTQSSSTNTSTSSGLTHSEIKIQNPKAGDFLSQDLLLEGEIQSSEKLERVRVVFNNTTIQEWVGGLGNSYRLFYVFTPQNIGPQNLLEILATTESGKTISKDIVLYK